MNRIPFLILLFPVLADGALVTFETTDGYAAGSLGVINSHVPATTDAPYTNANGWSRSTSAGTGVIVTTTSSGEYVGGQALQGGSAANQTFIGGLKGIVELTVGQLDQFRRAISHRHWRRIPW